MNTLSGSLKKKAGKKMLRVYFGPKENAIYNTSANFRNNYDKKWLLDDFAKEVIRDVDNSEVLDSYAIKSPVLGIISPEDLSGGVKALILMKNYPGKIFNASNCGDNCAKWILELAKERNFTINLYHVMDFGKGNFEIKIMNSRKKMIVRNMDEFLDAADLYLGEGM